MKKIIITTVLCLFAFIAEAQENKFAANRSENAVALISSQMDISDANAEFLQQTLYNKYATNAKKLKEWGFLKMKKKRFTKQQLKKHVKN